MVVVVGGKGGQEGKKGGREEGKKGKGTRLYAKVGPAVAHCTVFAAVCIYPNPVSI